MSLSVECYSCVQDDHDNMHEVDILDMNVLDDTENDNGIPAEDADGDMEHLLDEDAMFNDDVRKLEEEARDPEVTH